MSTDVGKPGGVRAQASVPVHRVRFVDWSPSPITALAISPVPAAHSGVRGASRSLLAVGHDNGNIDICAWCEDASASTQTSIARGWTPVFTLLGDENYKIEALAFTVSTKNEGEPPFLRLFSTSGGSLVFEHFLPACIAYLGERSVVTRTKTGTSVPSAPTRTLASHGGAIWSMAASPTGRYLAIGCEDGIVRMIDVAGDAFEHVGAGMRVAPRMSRVASRILSLAWGPPRRETTPGDDSDDNDEADAWVDTFLLGGLGNSTAAVWDVASGQLRSRLTVLKNRNEHTIVWSVAVLRDGTLVTGDSTGRVTFFDARTRIPIPGATFQCHTAGADVLTLCVSADARAVYSAGVDQKVVEYTSVGRSWAQTGTRRLHAHDIRALAMDPPLQFCAPSLPNQVPILVSGGLDFHLVLTPASHTAWRSGHNDANPVSSSNSTSFADTTQRRVAFVPANAREGVVSMAPLRRWVMLRRERSLAIWAVGTGEESWHKVWELELKTRSNLGAAAISADGRFVAASDLYETKLYMLEDGKPPCRVRTLGSAMHSGRDVRAPGASALAFTPDSTRLVVCTVHGAYVHVVQMPQNQSDEPRLLKSFGQHRTRRTAADGRVLRGHAKSGATPLDTDSTVERDEWAPILLAAVSPDGQWLVTADAGRHMHVFHLDTMSYERALASPACVPSSACFHPTQPSLLAITLPTNHVAFYDLDTEDAPAWEGSLCRELDAHLSRIREPVAGCVWLEGASGASLCVYGPTWLCTARPLLSRTAVRKKRQRSAQDDASADASAWSVRTTFKYQPLLYVGALASPASAHSELLVVERPYFALASTLPPAFYRGAKYGV